TGLIPKDCIVSVRQKAGVPDGIDSVLVRHVSGGTSIIQFKSYEQGWEAFTGSAVHVIRLDESPDARVYTECLVRTMTTDGLLLVTFTPVMGVTEVVQSFLEAYGETQFSKF
ncbi:MAG TPA: terminase family protein, partial [Bacillota bacterium]|nr:terminase family protein [Bacillota bacterium]